MTDNDIVKALECCMGCDCKECPNFNENDIDAECCVSRLIVEALKLINRQKAEIDRFADIGKMYSEVRAEVIKKFAGRLKIQCFLPLGTWIAQRICTEETIDKLVKEMTEETK